MSRDPLDRAAELFESAGDSRSLGEPDAAIAQATRALKLFRTHAGSAHPDVGNTLDLLACLHRDQGVLVSALRLHRHALRVLTAHRRHAAVRPMYLQALTHLGGTLRDLGRYREARTALSKAVTLGRRTTGDALATALNEYGMVCKYAGWWKAGAKAYAEALTIAESLPVPDPMMVATVLHNIGGLDHARGCPKAAVGPARRGLALRIANVGKDHPAVAADQGALAAILVDLGSHDEAEKIYRGLLARTKDTAEKSVLCHNLGALLGRTGRSVDALEVIRQGLKLGRKALGEQHPEHALTLHNLGTVLVSLGRRAAARKAFAEAVEIARRALGPRHPTTVACSEGLQSLG